MLTRHLRWTLCIVGLLALLVAPQVSAQNADQRTIFTFSQPVTLPGKTLPAGTYEFMTADIADRQVIQVFQQGGTKIMATLFAVPKLRNDRPKASEIRFLETSAGMPQAVQSWWYVGMTTGHEFIYPRAQARLLAKTNPNGVLTAEGEKGEVKRLTAQGDDTKEVKAEPATEQPVSGRALEGQPATPPPPPAAVTPAPRDNGDNARKALPKTASGNPAFFTGLLLLAAALASVAGRFSNRG